MEKLKIYKRMEEYRSKVEKDRTTTHKGVEDQEIKLTLTKINLLTSL